MDTALVRRTVIDPNHIDEKEISMSVSSHIRSEQVGSLLRPPALLEAVERHDAGELGLTRLRAAQDSAIVAVIEKQKSVGVDVLTDGEYRRTGFVTGFMDAVDGFVAGPVPVGSGRGGWRGGTGTEVESPNLRVVGARLRARGRIASGEAAVLSEHADRPFKITLPGPMLIPRIGWEDGVTDAVYADRDELIQDAAAILAEEIRLLGEQGVGYVQIDSPSYTHWGDPALVRKMRDTGVDPEELLTSAIAGDNIALDAAPPEVVTAVHLCRGNSMGRWLADGGYEPLAERLFTELRCQRFLLEYDSERAGGFEPLRFVPADKTVVLGLISSKTGVMESRDDVLTRIDEASKYVPIERLALSPQCGFASSGRGNPITEDEQWRKLELVVSIANEVWPS
jgi:5-methyltetrahydropteroyltriglutamate--homocysteine methyltransferase